MIKRYPDYKSYIERIKYNNLCCDLYTRLSKRINTIEEELNNDINGVPKKSTEVVYNSPTVTTQNINSTSSVTFIQDPIDITTNFHSRYILNSENIVNGIQKTIINRSDINKYKIVSLISINIDGNGGFSNAGNQYNAYIFSSKDVSVSLVWDDIQKYWAVINYNGVFQNIT